MMNETELAKLAFSALSQCNNNPDSDRKAHNFAIESMFKLQMEKKITLNTPMRILWKLTGLCNAGCLHCWASLGKTHPSDALYKTAYDIINLDVMMVSLSGGEPFLCKEIFNIIKILKKNNTILEIMSNGSLVTEEVAERLSNIIDLETDVVQISLDGSSAEIHDKQRNSRIFNATINGIKNLRRYNIKVRIAFCATYINQFDVFNTYKLANSLDVQTFSAVPVFKFRKASLFEDTIDSKQYLEELIRCKEFEREAVTQLRLYADQFYQYLIYSNYESLDTDSFFCELNDEDYIIYPNETNASIQIDATGEVVPGPEWDVDMSAGNAYEEDLKVIWERGLNWDEFRNGRDLRGVKCRSCKVFQLCGGGNMKYAFEKYGSINMPDGTCLLGGER